MAFIKILSKYLKSATEKVGVNPKATYAVVAVACANAIFKPLSTMLDKKEKPETKKYTALREFLTECVAVPTYIACGQVAEKFANTFKDPQKAKVAKANLNFIGVCTAAIFVIPALCSVVIKPMTDMIYHRGDQKPQPAKVDAKSNVTFENQAVTKPELMYDYHKYSFASFRNGGLKV